MTVKWTATLAVFALLAACGGGADRTKAQVRLVNASADYASLDLRVEGQVRQGAVTYANTAGYVEVDPDEADTAVTLAGSGTALLSFTPSLSARKHYTVLAYGATGALKQLLLDENTGEPDSNKSLLRVLNAAPDAGSVDVYLTGSDDLLTSAVPVEAGAALGTLNNWITQGSGTWRLRVTGANNKADLRLDVQGLVLASKQVATLVLSSAKGGVLVNGLLVTQQSGLARQDVTQARVRAVAGVADSAAVTVELGGTTALLDGTASPAVGNYMLVAAGSQPLVVKVNGASLPASTLALAAGRDYTVLVHGSTGSPLASAIDDDNRLPADSTQARIRLVNGVSGLAPAATASLTVDLLPIGSGVVAGAASIYDSVTATSTAELAVTSAGLGSLYSELDRTLLAGSTYSVFVLGASTAPKGLLRKDR